MNGYELFDRPFFANRETQTRLYHGTSKKLNQPVVAKRHDIHYVEKAQFTEEFNMVMNVGMAQARVEHPNTCKILEFCLDVDFQHGDFFVYHILEALEKDLGKEITDRKQNRQVPSEAEVRNFLLQTTQALTYAHAKGIAHRDIKPDNIFLDRKGTFKVGDFGTFYEKKASTLARTATGTVQYMSPQQRGTISGAAQGYDAFKSDVYSLGLTALSLASLTVFKEPWTIDILKQTAEAKVQELGYSAALSHLLLAMLEESEGARPTMQQVCSALQDSRAPVPTEEVKSPVASNPIYTPPARIPPADRAVASKELVTVSGTFLRLFNFQASTWGPQIPLKIRIEADNWSIWVILEDGRVFVCGGRGLNKAYILARDGAIEVKKCMQEARGWHGVFALYNAVYVFGGYRNGSRLKTCEKYLLLNNTWSPLPPMQEARDSFNPCMLLGVVYLCGWGASSMEAFAPDTFLPCPITIPEECYACCLYVQNNILVVNTRNYILKYAIAGGQLVEQSRLNTPEVSKGQNSQPVVDRGLYFMVYEGKCVRFRMETGEERASIS